MTDKKALELLRQNIKDERAAMIDRHELYRSLTSKMMAYQSADGPAPSMDEFEIWLAAVEEAHRVRQLNGE